MTCPSDSLIADYVHGAIPPAVLAKLRKHVEQCPSCTRRVARLKPLGDTRRSPGSGPSTAATLERGSVSRSPFDPAPLKRGDSVGRYVIDSEIGIGGMGVVYLAYDPALDRRVALKLLRPDTIVGQGISEGRSRLQREAHAMAKLNHPNVVAIHDVGQHGDQVFLAMNLVDGASIREWLEEQPRTWRQILKIYLEAGRGLEAAHAVGLIHRDFKPDNVLIDSEGRAQVTDFGLARASTAEPTPEEAARAPMIRGHGPASRSDLLSQPLTRGVSGTPGYMSPEQALSKPFDARTDQYSFCVSLSESLFGPKPENAEWAPVRDPDLAAAVPGWVRAAVERGMALAPSDRFPSMHELLAALSDDPAERQRRLLVVVGGLALLAAVVGLGVYIADRRSKDLCYAPEHHLAGIWDDQSRAVLKAAFAALGTKDQADTAERVVKGLDRVTSRWVEGYRSACEDTRDKHVQSEAALSLRVECLDRQLYDLKGSIELLSHPDAALLSTAAVVAMSLPPVAECGNAFSLSLVAPPGPELADKVRTLRLQIARGRALIAAQRMAEALALLQPLTREAEAAKYDPVSSEAFFSLARAQLNFGDHKHAAESFQQALDLAESSRLDELAARAVSLLAGELALVGAPAAEVDVTLKRARILTKRVGDKGLARLELEVALERVAGDRGQFADEVSHGQEALRLTEELLGQSDPKLLTALNNLASDLIEDARFLEAAETYRKAIDLSRSLFGPKASGSKVLWARYADLLAGLGRSAEALQAAERALEAKGERPDDANSAMAWAIKGFALARDHKLADAKSAIQRAIEIGEDLELSTVVDFDEVNLFVCETAVLIGEPKLAVEAYERNLVADKDLDSANPGWVGNCRVGGEAYLADGQPTKARRVLERGLALASGHAFLPRWIPDLRFRLAQALIATEGDERRAGELVHAARADLERLPEEKPLLDELNAWAAAKGLP